jgi:hypothetical protein
MTAIILPYGAEASLPYWEIMRGNKNAPETSRDDN